MPRALVIVDIQNDYFPGGAFPLVGPEEAAASASSVLGSFRNAGAPIAHIQHVWDEPDAEFMVPGTEGIEIHSAVAPIEGEPVFQKEEPNSFLRTGLEEQLRSWDVEEIVVGGMMTSLCVDATVRAGSDLGFAVTVLQDACAAPDLEFGGITVPAASVNAAFLAPLADSYATIIKSDELLADTG
jgi:nicotinamidase-related amidase